MKNYANRGFTLIELLVVIAIIGILSSVVLASLNTARSKGGDAAVKGNLTGVRPQAEIVYDGVSPNSYATVCSNANVTNAVNSARTSGSGTAGCSADADEWVVYATLKTASGSYFCVDYKGNATTTTKSSYTTDANQDCD
ncbi:MAG: type II secretion system protein [Patescibacteria group bacterium]